MHSLRNNIFSFNMFIYIISFALKWGMRAGNAGNREREIYCNFQRTVASFIYKSLSFNSFLFVSFRFIPLLLLICRYE